jgi:alkanesulfonate monooxygenase SsuD/methylene tetrahydromethanopterin reductase-like flavin-dependent oxidoreductase (luciferase family)
MPDASAETGTIPIMLAAVNELMVRLCGEKADGFLGHPFSSPRYLSEVALPALHAAIDAAGRKREEVEVVQSVIVRVAASRAEAIDSAKAQIAFYGTTRTYKPVFDLHGYGDVVAPLRDAHKRGDLKGMVDLITDEMAETYAAFGTPEECREQIKRYDGLADTIVLNTPWAFPGARSDEVLTQLLEAFAR